MWDAVLQPGFLLPYEQCVDPAISISPDVLQCRSCPMIGKVLSQWGS